VISKDSYSRNRRQEYMQWAIADQRESRMHHAGSRNTFSQLIDIPQFVSSQFATFLAPRSSGSRGAVPRCRKLRLTIDKNDTARLEALFGVSGRTSSDEADWCLVTRHSGARKHYFSHHLGKWLLPRQIRSRLSGFARTMPR
jgi:hypothetical protein